MSGPPPDPKAGRQRRLGRFLGVAGSAVLVAAALALVLPGRAGEWAGVAVVVLLIAVPLARLAWLAQRWVRRGDVRYALVAGLLALVILAGGLVGR